LTYSPLLLSLEEKDNGILFYSLAKHLAQTNTLFILQTFKIPHPLSNIAPYERQFWALIPPGGNSEGSTNPFEYHIESMVLMQLCDQESFLICSNSSMQISTRPFEVNSDLEYLLGEERERENEMRDFVETSTKLLESVELYNPLAFVSRKYQIPSLATQAPPSQSQYPPRRKESELKIAEERKMAKSIPISQKRPPPVTSSTSKFHSKRVKTRVRMPS
jgi:hypothetical protein